MAKKKYRIIDPAEFFIGGGESSEEQAEKVEEAIDPSSMRLWIHKEKKGRAGKVVTLIEGFEGSESALNDLSRDIKQHVGTGGSCKEGIIIIQGDRVKQIEQYLLARGYPCKKTSS